MQSIEIEFQYNKDTLKQAYRFYLKKNLLGKWWLWAIILLILAYNLFNYDYKTGGPIANYAYIGTLILISGLFYWSLFYRVPGMWANKLLKIPEFKNKMKWVITEEKIVVTSLNATGELKWNYFDKAIFNKQFLLLVPQQQILYILPANCFKGNDIELFKTWIRQNIKKVTE